MIGLGCVDPGVSEDACRAYVDTVQRLTLLPLSSVGTGMDKFVQRRLETAPGAMSVRQVQQALRELGFFPGGQDDGICGYRTMSAVRLFQEYLRSVEGAALVPDGVAGPRTQAEIRRWQQQALRPAAWQPAIDAWRSGTPLDGEYRDWLALLRSVKQAHLAEPTAVDRLVEAFGRPTDTRRVAQWDYDDPQQMHLIGISRQQVKNLSDDIFVLLIKGLVFKFQGSTEPGEAAPGKQPPFLVPGQHDYRFGWHRSTYLALRPKDAGVLVVRSPQFDPPLHIRWTGGPPEALQDINIHWGGIGLKGAVNAWSHGCQVVSGGLYLGADNRLVDCTSFAAVGSKDPLTRADKTRGAYSLLVDLITALGSDIPGNTLRYTLLLESDLARAPALQQSLESDRQRLMRRAGIGV